MRKRIFISHKRNNGQATTDAILIKDIITKEVTPQVFMDVTEDYLGKFPDTLKNEIKKSNVFILVLPSTEKTSFLCDPDNWVHKEIKYALTFKDANNKPSKIIPIVFDKDFKFPPRESLGDIADITNYSFLYFDTNSKDSISKLKRAIGSTTPKWLKPLFLIITSILLIVAGIKYINPDTVIPDTPLNQESITFKETLNKLNSFNTFNDECSNALNQYLTWYLESLSSNDFDPQVNKEFNELYIKEYCIRYAVLTYLAFTSCDMDKEYNKEYIDSYVNKCYAQIPEELRYPISLDNITIETRTKNFRKIIDIIVDELNADPSLRTIDPEMISVLKQKLIGKMWPY